MFTNTYIPADSCCLPRLTPIHLAYSMNCSLIKNRTFSMTCCTCEGS